MSETKGKIFAIKNFEIHDGDGLRTTVFLKGCPLRCRWCHNPEGLEAKSLLAFYKDKCRSCGMCARVCPSGAHTTADGVHVYDRSRCTACGACERVCPSGAIKIFGEEIGASELVGRILPDRLFFDTTGGGITLSGGEPLLQPDFCKEVLMRAKIEGIGTAVDSCLCVSAEAVRAVMPYTDKFLVDVKCADSRLHERLTGVGSGRIIANLALLCENNCRVEIRVPYIPDCNDGEMPAIAELLCDYKSCITAVKVLGYHNYAENKYTALGMNYPAADVRLPTADELSAARGFFSDKGFAVISD